MENLETTVDAADSLATLASSIDTVWVLLGAMLVFMMQMGFAAVEAGMTRSKNTTNILMKNLLDFSIGTVLFTLFGYRIMFGQNALLGLCSNPFALGDAIPTHIPSGAFLIFQTMFCATTATIVSGAVAERTKFSAYFVYCMAISAIVYPVAAHWSWGGGWLSELGFHDFAGSAVVHSVGGWVAMVGAAVVGPRIGKYGKDGKPRPLLGHSLTIATLGVFILWMGWFGFNPASSLSASTAQSASSISHIFITTNMAAATGAISSLLYVWWRDGRPSLSLTLNGVLAGLVAITAGCDAVSIGGAAAIGCIAGVVMVISVSLFDHVFKIDDPVGAVSVHAVNGTLGTILTGVFATDGGVLYGGGVHLLTVQAIGAATYAAWALVCAVALFSAIKHTIGMRVEARIEEDGLDYYEHGETAYN